MHQSNNVNDGALQFHMKVTKSAETGKTTASCPAHPGVPPCTADTHASAVRAMQGKLEKAASGGKLKSK